MKNRKLTTFEKGWNAAIRKAAKIVALCRVDHEEGGKKCACPERVLSNVVRK